MVLVVVKTLSSLKYQGTKIPKFENSEFRISISNHANIYQYLCNLLVPKSKIPLTKLNWFTGPAWVWDFEISILVTWIEPGSVWFFLDMWECYRGLSNCKVWWKGILGSVDQSQFRRHCRLSHLESSDPT